MNGPFYHHRDYKTEYQALAKFEDIVGKTVSRVEGGEYSSDSTIVFTDKTYIQLEADPYDCEEASLRINKLQPVAYMALGLGLIDQAEYERSFAEHTELKKAADKKQKLAEFEKLKAELGEESQ